MTTKHIEIDVTHCDLATLVRAAYDLSVPQGMGFLHAQPGSLSDAEVASILSNPRGLVMDYVKGRAIKLTVYQDDGRKYFYGPWYDHTEAQLDELLTRIGASRPGADPVAAEPEVPATPTADPVLTKAEYYDSTIKPLMDGVIKAAQARGIAAVTVFAVDDVNDQQGERVMSSWGYENGGMPPDLAVVALILQRGI